MQKLEKRLLEKFGYQGDEILVNPATGSEDSAENWACEANGWSETEEEIFEKEVIRIFEHIKEENTQSQC